MTPTTDSGNTASLIAASAAGLSAVVNFLQFLRAETGINKRLGDVGEALAELGRTQTHIATQVESLFKANRDDLRTLFQQNHEYMIRVLDYAFRQPGAAEGSSQR